VGDGGWCNQLTVTNAARLSSFSAWIGGDNNTVAVVGANSRWDTAPARAQLVVGVSGYGNRLLISEGAQVSGWDGIVSSSNNTVEVSGAGALWHHPDVLRLGEDFGVTNRLTISDGGRANSGETSLAGDYGVLKVRGAGALLSAGASLSVGEEIGAGNRLIISQGGRVTNLLGCVGGTVSAFDPHGRNVGNLAAITGAGSVWDNASDLLGGATGPGSQLTVSEGGQVTDAFGYLGFYGSAFDCQARVSDAGSLWHDRADLFVGYQSSGNLFVTNISTSGLLDLGRLSRPPLGAS
jgi:T5SS/PEP-CTERM-associated repeat protein